MLTGTESEPGDEITAGVVKNQIVQFLLALEFTYAQQLYIRRGNGALRREDGHSGHALPDSWPCALSAREITTSAWVCWRLGLPWRRP